MSNGPNISSMKIGIVDDGRNIYQKAADECFAKGIEFPEELKCIYYVHQDICDGHMDLSLRKLLYSNERKIE